MQIKIDLNRKIGEIKKMNATGQAPMGGGIGYGAYKKFHLLSWCSAQKEIKNNTVLLIEF